MINGFVYFFRCEDHVKIGATMYPRDRIVGLRRMARALFGDRMTGTMNYMVVVPGYCVREEAIHNKFNHLRAWEPINNYVGPITDVGGHCEWFRLDENLKTYIRQLQQSEDVAPEHWPPSRHIRNRIAAEEKTAARVRQKKKREADHAAQKAKKPPTR